MQKLLIATNNQGKVEEFRDLLKNLRLELVTPHDIGLNLEVEEDGSTYARNAEKKALAFAQASGLVSLADDSGLAVDALGGAPGLFSNRYLSKPNATDADRRGYLLKNLGDKPRPWTATFHAAIAIAIPGNPSVQFAAGECRGEIIPDERGTGGFGYDRIFFIPEVNRTMAELDMEEKNRVSHRARAISSAKPLLRSLFGP
ncbi:MAG TPA: RdgB/HAM1 family non-canonical purine NTP pyrophosphatase [Anaerolineales bacterium]|nr:RdgB/HAM1 family non-canonical purine NTP pyrophosphatase [Anaerolineales bacterium]